MTAIPKSLTYRKPGRPRDQVRKASFKVTATGEQLARLEAGLACANVGREKPLSLGQHLLSVEEELQALRRTLAELSRG